MQMILSLLWGLYYWTRFERCSLSETDLQEEQSPLRLFSGMKQQFYVDLDGYYVYDENNNLVL